MTKREYLLNGRVELRPDDRGEFDELVMGDCSVHFEMMSDDVLWIGLYPKEGGDDCVHISVHAKGQKLNIKAFEA